MINDRTLKNLKPKSKPFEIADGDGLGVRMRPSGKIVFFHRYSFEGKQHRNPIGNYPGIGLAEARKIIYQESQLLDQGINPVEQKKELAVEKRTAPTVAEQIEEFYEKYLKTEWKDSKAPKQLLDANIRTELGKMKIKDVKRIHIIQALDKIVERGAPKTANRVLTLTKLLFQNALERGVIEDNPALAIRKKTVGGTEKSRDRSLSPDEIRSFWDLIDEAPFERVTALVLKVLLLTGQRSGEVAYAEWSEVDLKNKVWNLPAHKTKTKKANKVPLSPQAVACFEELLALSCNSLFVCQSPKGTMHKPIARASIGKAVKRHLEFFGFETPWTPHDLRHTVKTEMAELGIPKEVRDAIQNHAREGMDSVYNQAEYLVQKRAALDKWANWIEGLVQERGKVIQFPGMSV